MICNVVTSPNKMLFLCNILIQGGSEMWSVIASETTTVIASLAFHPSERLLVIATNSTLYFWDWNFPQPFAKCSTANEKQKLRYQSVS